MTHALLKGADGTSKRERGLRLQPEAPEFLTRSSAKPNYLRCIAESLPRQEENRKPVRLGADGSTLILNPGQLRKALKAVRRMVFGEYGRQGCTDPYAAQQFFLAYAAIENAVSSDDLYYERTLDRWAPRRLPGLTADSRARAIGELRGFSGEVTARFLGELLGLSHEQRKRYRFWLADAGDLTAEEAALNRRAADAKRKRDKRRKIGIRPKGEALAIVRKLYPDASPATHTRRARELKGAKNA